MINGYNDYNGTLKVNNLILERVVNIKRCSFYIYLPGWHMLNFLSS